MKKTVLHIQNMCCQRCIDAVTTELKNLNVKTYYVKLGEAEVEAQDKAMINNIQEALKNRGFDINRSNEEIIAEKVRTAIYELIDENIKAHKQLYQLHDFLEAKLKMSYRSFARIFSSYKKMSIERYFISIKIEKSKDLIGNSHLQFQEIADALGYKSLQHLSAQFKKITGVTMSQYKATQVKKRTFLDRI